MKIVYLLSAVALMVLSPAVKAQKGAGTVVPSSISLKETAKIMSPLTLPNINSQQVLIAANEAFPNLSSEMPLDKLLNKVGSDGTMRGNLRGRLAELDWIERNKVNGWKQTASKIAPENDAYRKVNGKWEGAQIKVHSNWKKYIGSMRTDSKAESFVIPDDHHKLVSEDLEKRIAGASRGGQIEKVAEYRRMQSRLQPLGRTFSKLDQAIEDAAIEARQAAKAAGKTATSAASTSKSGNAFGKVLTGVGVLGTAVQAYEGVQEIKIGDTGKGSAHLTGSAAETVSALAAIAGKTALTGVAGAAGAGIDGGVDLYDGISQRDLKKTIVGSVKSAAATTMAAGAVMGNPMVVMVGGVTYGGAVMGELVYDNREAIIDGISYTAEAARDVMDEAAITIYNHSPSFLTQNGTVKKTVGWLTGY